MNFSRFCDSKERLVSLKMPDFFFFYKSLEEKTRSFSDFGNFLSTKYTFFRPKTLGLVSRRDPGSAASHHLSCVCQDWARLGSDSQRTSASWQSSTGVTGRLSVSRGPEEDLGLFIMFARVRSCSLRFSLIWRERSRAVRVSGRTLDQTACSNRLLGLSGHKSSRDLVLPDSVISTVLCWPLVKLLDMSCKYLLQN